MYHSPLNTIRVDLIIPKPGSTHFSIHLYTSQKVIQHRDVKHCVGLLTWVYADVRAQERSVLLYGDSCVLARPDVIESGVIKIGSHHKKIWAVIPLCIFTLDR